MSIIYDALKKLEKSNPGNLGLEVKGQEKRLKFQIKTYTYLLYLLVVCLGIFVGNIFFSFLSRPKTIAVGAKQKRDHPELAKQVAPAPAPTPAPAATQGQEEEESLETEEPIAEAVNKEPAEQLVLNGIFFSDEKGYALINNQIVKEGDVIGGSTVKRIGLDEVELEFEGSAIKLYTNK